MRHVPLHATLAPMRMPSRVLGGNFSFSRAKSPTLSNETTVAVPCTRPVKSATGLTAPRDRRAGAGTTLDLRRGTNAEDLADSPAVDFTDVADIFPRSRRDDGRALDECG